MPPAPARIEVVPSRDMEAQLVSWGSTADHVIPVRWHWSIQIAASPSREIPVQCWKMHAVNLLAQGIAVEQQEIPMGIVMAQVAAPRED